MVERDSDHTGMVLAELHMVQPGGATHDPITHGRTRFPLRRGSDDCDRLGLFGQTPLSPIEKTATAAAAAAVVPRPRRSCRPKRAKGSK